MPPGFAPRAIRARGGSSPRGPVQVMRGWWRHGDGQAGPSAPPASRAMVVLPVGTQRAAGSLPDPVKPWDPSHVTCWLIKLETVSPLHESVRTLSHSHTHTHVWVLNV